MISRLHIAVCGAGPAGLAAALALIRQGHRITVFEQFEQPKPLGSGLILQPTGLAVLVWLGLGNRMWTLGSRIDRLHGKARGSGRVVLDVRYEALGAARGLAVHRAALFNVLYEAVQVAGIDVQTACQIKGLDGTSLILNQRQCEGPFDLIVDALGSRSPLIAHGAAADVRKRLDYGAIWASLPWPEPPFDAHALEQRYDKASIMVGVLPIGRQSEGAPDQIAFFWSLKTQDFPAWRDAGLERCRCPLATGWCSSATAPMRRARSSGRAPTWATGCGSACVRVG